MKYFVANNIPRSWKPIDANDRDKPGNWVEISKEALKVVAGVDDLETDVPYRRWDSEQFNIEFWVLMTE